MITTPKWLAIVAVAFVAGSFVASPELRAYAANTVFSTDIVDGQVKTADLGASAVTAAKIKDGEVKAAEIATDAVGGSELQGVTKLLFGQCKLDSNEASALLPPGGQTAVACTITGVDSDDTAIAMYNPVGGACFATQMADTATNLVTVYLINECSDNQRPGATTMGVIVFDK